MVVGESINCADVFEFPVGDKSGGDKSGGIRTWGVARRTGGVERSQGNFWEKGKKESQSFTPAKATLASFFNFDLLRRNGDPIHCGSYLPGVLTYPGFLLTRDSYLGFSPSRQPAGVTNLP